MAGERPAARSFYGGNFSVCMPKAQKPENDMKPSQKLLLATGTSPVDCAEIVCGQKPARMLVFEIA
jgi:hypothetical protein